MQLLPVALAGVSVDEGRGSLYGGKISGPLGNPVQARIEAHTPAASIRSESIPCCVAMFKWVARPERGLTCSGPGLSSPVFFAASDTVWRAAAADSNVCLFADNDAAKSV